MPTRQRDQSGDIELARWFGAPEKMILEESK